LTIEKGMPSYKAKLTVARNLLAALKVHDLRNALKTSKKRGIVKKYGKKGSDRSEGHIGRVLNGFMSLSTLQTKAKALKIRQKVCGVSYWGRSPHNLGLKNFTLNRKKLV